MTSFAIVLLLSTVVGASPAGTPARMAVEPVSLAAASPMPDGRDAVAVLGDARSIGPADAGDRRVDRRFAAPPYPSVVAAPFAAAGASVGAFGPGRAGAVAFVRTVVVLGRSGHGRGWIVATLSRI